ncbi:hypothetical protein BC739_002089 [Kutzneria viridogrisea]|uniref:Uncharacterized protein n=1 Tax=Kutzneria viridogrisea TaxID=47990 RepID=A0ABR6BDE0_9PSEU|nr:hypothetical protein [Kutzneria viridogrisea]
MKVPFATLGTYPHRRESGFHCVGRSEWSYGSTPRHCHEGAVWDVQRRERHLHGMAPGEVPRPGTARKVPFATPNVLNGTFMT